MVNLYGVGAIAAFMLTAAQLPALAYSGEALSKDAKITISKAEEIALKAEPGKIMDKELEAETGGSGLRYSFDIKPTDGGGTHELGVDANTGEVLENSVDGAKPD